MTNAEIKSLFIQEIIDGKLSLSDVQGRIQEYEREYGSDFFSDYEIEKRNKPWDEAYFNELKRKSITMASKQFILHLAEVSEYVHSHEMKSNQEKNGKSKGLLLGISIVVAIIVFVIVLICLFSNSAAFAITSTTICLR